MITKRSRRQINLIYISTGMANSSTRAAMFKLFLVQPAMMGLSLIQLLGDGGDVEHI